MKNQHTTTTLGNIAKQRASQLGFWAAIFTALSAAAALGIAVATAPARSGPFCTTDLVERCITYPYTDVATYVPNDYLWMYPALLMGPLFVILVTCIHHYASAEQKLFSQIALSFATISATALVINYYIQLTTVQSSLRKGEVDGLSLFSQYNAHGVFIALEDVGYLLMGLTFLLVAPVFAHGGVLARTIRYLFFISGALVPAALIFLGMRYGSDMEYRFEVASLLIDWLTLIVAGVLLSILFRRAGLSHPAQQSVPPATGRWQTQM